MENYKLALLKKVCQKLPHPAQAQIAYEEACERFGEDKVMLVPQSYISKALDEQTTNELCYMSDLGRSVFSGQSMSSILGEPRGFWKNFSKAVHIAYNELSVWSLVIHFPIATVTNEHNESTVIYDLFAKIRFSPSGSMMSIEYCRTTFTQEQIDSGYCHSHAPRFHDFTSLSAFAHVCLGSGPIRDTLYYSGGELSAIRYKLFFIQLDTIVHSESLAGGPYIKLSSIGVKWKPLKFAPEILRLNPKNTEALKTALKSYLDSGRMSLSYQNGRFKLACSFTEWVIDLSDYLHKWLNTVPEDQAFYYNGIFVLCHVLNNTFVQKEGVVNHRNFNQYRGKEILKFKDESFGLKILPTQEPVETTPIQVIRPQVAYVLLQQILNVVTYQYERKEQTTYDETINAFTKGKHTIASTSSKDAIFV